MKLALIYALPAIVVAALASGPISASVSGNTATSLQLPDQSRGQARLTSRIIQLHASQLSLTVLFPDGCSSNGPNSFVGGGVANFAGGGVSGGKMSGRAGVVAGFHNEACDIDSFVGAGEYNTIGGNDASRSEASVIGGGSGNSILAYDALIASGDGNIISGSKVQAANASAIISGQFNTVSSSNLSFIGAGSNNTIFAQSNAQVFDAPSDFIGAGYDNQVGSNFASVVGGQKNSVTGDFAIIAGGYANSVSGEYAAIAGGNSNGASGVQANVAGGYGNVASGRDSAIPGGSSNIASGSNSFAAGTGSIAATTGSFVWSDASAAATTLASSTSNQFLARATGGFVFYSSANLKSGVRLAPGSGSWSTLSDRAVKTGVAEVDDARILAKVAALPVSEWSYSAQGDSVRHLGPMAQDFRAAFGLGEDDQHISTVDEEGVALAAIKALQAELAAKDRKLDKLEARLDALEHTVTTR